MVENLVIACFPVLRGRTIFLAVLYPVLRGRTIFLAVLYPMLGVRILFLTVLYPVLGGRTVFLALLYPVLGGGGDVRREQGVEGQERRAGTPAGRREEGEGEVGLEHEGVHQIFIDFLPNF